MVLRANVVMGMALSLLAILLRLSLTYTIFTAFTVKHNKPTLGPEYRRLLALVATQVLSISGALLAARHRTAFSLELNLIALSMWLWGGILYIWMMSLIFHFARSGDNNSSVFPPWFR